MKKKTNKKSVDRSSEDGKFVTKQYAKEHPNTTEHEKVPIANSKNNTMKKIKLPSQFQIGADVNFITKHNKRHPASQKGVVMGVRFTEGKVWYDVKDKHFGVTNRDVDSCDVTADVAKEASAAPVKAKAVAKKTAPVKKAKAVKAPVAKKAAPKKTKSKGKK